MVLLVSNIKIFFQKSYILSIELKWNWLNLINFTQSIQSFFWGGILFQSLNKSIELDGIMNEDIIKIIVRSLGERGKRIPKKKDWKLGSDEHDQGETGKNMGRWNEIRKGIMLLTVVQEEVWK